MREELALRLRDLTLAESAHDVDEEPLRVVIGDSGGDELEEQVRRGVEMTLSDVVASGFESLRCRSRVSTRRLPTRSPVASSSRSARAANPSAPMLVNSSSAVRSWSRASRRRRSRRSHSP